MWSQHLRRFCGAPHRINPMPSLPGNDCVERSAAGVPILECADLDVDTGLLGELGHPRVHVDAEHPAPGSPVLPCPEAGAAADIQKVDAGTGGDDTLDQRIRVARPGPVISFGINTE
jgi:hypothetical protein